MCEVVAADVELDGVDTLSEVFGGCRRTVDGMFVHLCNTYLPPVVVAIDGALWKLQFMVVDVFWHLEKGGYTIVLYTISTRADPTTGCKRT